MAFGRRKHDRDDAAAPEAAAEEYVAAEEYSEDANEQSLGSDVEEYPQELAEWGGDEVDGPFDIEDFETPEQAALARLDLGSVLIPMPPGRQIQVEFDQTGVPTAIWVVTPNGRFTIAAYAAPKSRGLWREVAAELAQALRNDNAVVAIEDGPWGREVVGAGAGVVRFIGVDGFRWMVRCVVNGMPQAMPALVAEAREALADTVIRRGDTPLPVRTPLPVEIPEELAAQMRAVAAQQAQQQQAVLAAQQAYLAQQQQQQAAERAGLDQLRSTSTGG